MYIVLLGYFYIHLLKSDKIIFVAAFHHQIVFCWNATSVLIIGMGTEFV